MKRFFLVVLALFLVAPNIPAAFGQVAKPTARATAETPEQKVRAAEQKWQDALYRLDMATLEGSEANDFVLITPTVVSTKQQHLAAMRPRLADAALPPVKYSVSQQKIRFYGTIAIVTEIHSVENSAQNPPVTSPGRYLQTEVWHNENGVWKIVHLHMSPIARRRM